MLDCPLDSCFSYIYQYEPYLKDPVGFPRVMVSLEKKAEAASTNPRKLKTDLLPQMLVYFFYAVPLLTVFIYGLSTPGCSWMLDWSVFFAGAVAQVRPFVVTAAAVCWYSPNTLGGVIDFLPLFSQTQWCHIGASLHSRTPFTYRIPSDKLWPVITVNVLLAAVPTLLALRCYASPAFFHKPVPIGQTNGKKKKN